MNLIQLFNDRFLLRNDTIHSSYDKIIICVFIYCILPIIELSHSTRNNNIYHDDESESIISQSYNDYPENFFHMTRD